MDICPTTKIKNIHRFCQIEDANLGGRPEPFQVEDAAIARGGSWTVNLPVKSVKWNLDWNCKISSYLRGCYSQTGQSQVKP